MKGSVEHAIAILSYDFVAHLLLILQDTKTAAITHVAYKKYSISDHCHRQSV